MSQLFRIYRLTEAEAEKIRLEPEPDDPHHHDYEEMMVGIRGIFGRKCAG